MKVNDLFTGIIEKGKLFKLRSIPSNVMIDISNRCNNRCVFCYNEDSYFQGEALELDKLSRVLKLLFSQGVREVLYLGGEPFYDAKVLELFKIAQKYNIHQRAVSNGEPLTSNFCKILKSCGMKEIGISFHSSNYKTHDLIAGRKNSFEDAFNAIKSCKEAGIDVFVQYSPNKLNSKDDIILLYEFLLKNNYRIDCFDINRLLPVGQGDECQNIILDENEWFDFLIQAVRLIDKGVLLRTELTPYCFLDKIAELKQVDNSILKKIHSINRGCYMWIDQLPIDAFGRVKFCPAGAAVGPSLLEINSSLSEYWLNDPELKYYRSFQWNEECVDFSKKEVCKYFYRCLGGCKYSKGGPYEVDKLKIKKMEGRV